MLIECEAGPAFPEQDEPLEVWRPVIEQATFAAGVCQSRHRRLVEWVRRVTR